MNVLATWQKITYNYKTILVTNSERLVNIIYKNETY